MNWYTKTLTDSASLEKVYASGKRILVVEDSLCLQSGLIRLIKSVSPQAEVDWATTADEVKTTITEHRFPLSEFYGLVISDVVLPGETSGLDLWELCRSRFPSVQFILTSGMGVQEYLQAARSRAKEIPPFLPKPFTIGQCREALGIFLKKAA